MTGSQGDDGFKRSMSWPVVLFHIYLHMSALYGLFLIITQAYWTTIFYSLLLVVLGMLGVTAGSHRLWAHRTYKAEWPLRLFLMLAQTLSCQGSIYDWVLDHRLHHKHYGTDYDRYNFKRGFLYAHLSSRCLTDNPEMEKLAKEIDMMDIEEDSIVMFQKRLYWVLMPIVGLLLPVNAAVEYWGESILSAVFITGFLRVAILLHASWLITSSSIVWGLDPLDKKSAETSMVFLVNKSLWPQYHYLLPWDYQSGEYGTYGSGCATAFIRVMATLELASGLTTITTDGVRQALAAAAETNRPLVECLTEARTCATISQIISPPPIRTK